MVAAPALVNGPEPLHDQLTSKLRALAGEIGVGSRLPSEAELGSQYAVSRTTVRRAVQTLVDEGLVVRRQGVGAFVTQVRIAQGLDDVWAFAEILTRHGLRPKSSLVRYEWLNDESSLPPELAFSHDGGLAFRRIYSVDGEPYGVADAYIPAVFGRRLSRKDVEEHPSFEILQEREHVAVQRAQIVVHSRGAPGDVADALHLAEGSPILVLERTLYAAGGDLVQYSVHYLPGTKFEFGIEASLTGEHRFAYSFASAIPRLAIVGDDDGRAGQKRKTSNADEGGHGGSVGKRG